MANLRAVVEFLEKRPLCFWRNVPGEVCRQKARHSSLRNATSTIRQVSSHRKKECGYKAPSPPREPFFRAHYQA